MTAQSESSRQPPDALTERADEVMRASVAQGMKGPQSNERVLACVNSGPGALTIIRRAKSLAERLRAPWEAVNVATTGSERASRASRDALLEAFRVAEELGASTRSLTGDDPAAEILAYANDQNVTHIVVGAASRPLWIELFQGSIVRRLVRGAGDIAIEIAPRSNPIISERKAGATLSEIPRLPPIGDISGYVGATVLVALATALAVGLDQLGDVPNISLVFVLPVIAAAVRYGMATSIYTALVSALAYNYFLIPPLYTFTIADVSNIYANIFFVGVAVLVSGVAARSRAQTLIARRQARRAADLESFARSLVGAEDETQIAAITAETASKLLFARIVVLAPSGASLEAIAEAPGPEMLGADDLAAAQWALVHRRPAGRGSDTLNGARWLFMPVPGERGFVGVLGVRPMDHAARLDPDQSRMLDLIAAQAGVALDRARFAREAANARIEAESERLKGTLLSSVSHDLRTPLSTVRTAIESLQQFGDKHEPETRKQLLDAAGSEVRRLNRFIENLLDMSRIDAGVVRVKREAIEPADLVEHVIERAHAGLKRNRISRDVSSALPRIVVDAALAETALVNVLENAGKYAPDGSTILVRAFRKDHSVVIEVLDEGEGFPPGALPRLFDKFARGVEGDGRPAGTGLGLAIARGFLEAQSASIEAANRADRRGAIVSMTFPIEEG